MRTVNVQVTEIFTRDLHEVEGWIDVLPTGAFLIWSSMTLTIASGRVPRFNIQDKLVWNSSVRVNFTTRKSDIVSVKANSTPVYLQFFKFRSPGLGRAIDSKTCPEYLFVSSVDSREINVFGAKFT